MNKLFILSHIEEQDGINIKLKKGALLDDIYRSSRYVVEVKEGSLSAQSEITENKRVVISRLEEGAIFGISNLFIEDNLKTVLECEKDAKLFLVSKELFKRKLLENTAAIEYYAKTMNEKLQFLLSRIERLSLPSARLKVAYALRDGLFLENSNRDEIAASLAISRASLFRELYFFSDMNIIRRDGNNISIIDEEELDRIINE